MPPLDGSFVPVGLTDSERAFCWLLQTLRRASAATRRTSRRYSPRHALTLEIAQHGEFNFLLSNGDCLFAHASTKLSHIVRQAPFAQAHLKDQDVTVDFSDVTDPDDRVAVIATLPLTDNEVWTEMPPGTLWWFEEGAPVKTLPTAPGRSKSPDQDSLRKSSSAWSISASIFAEFSGVTVAFATTGAGRDTKREARMPSS
jgi:predicted glutamine amidotransferase